MKELKFEIPEGYEIDFDKSDFPNGKMAFRVKEIVLPKKWQDLKNISGYFVTDTTNIEHEEGEIHLSNKNVFCTYIQAKASIALAQLSQLRNVYRQGWEPIYRQNHTQEKFYISFFKDAIQTGCSMNQCHFLCFQTAYLRDDFLENFKDLILQAKPLMS